MINNKIDEILDNDTLLSWSAYNYGVYGAKAGYLLNILPSIYNKMISDMVEKEQMFVYILIF